MDSFPHKYTGHAPSDLDCFTDPHTAPNTDLHGDPYAYLNADTHSHPYALIVMPDPDIGL